MTDHEVTIVGAGFGGMGAAIALKRLGYGAGSEDLLILEREDDLGGTWHVNHYPGLAVDIASVTYSYSFEPNPNWEHWFARGAELKRYAERVADKYDLRRHMRFGVVVDGARWDEDERHWVVTTASGSHTTRFLLTATGFLSQPRLPDIEGVHDFAGEVIPPEVGRHGRPDRQAGGRDRDGRHRRTADPRDRRRRLRADRLPAHAHLGDTEDRLPHPQGPAATVRRGAVDPAGRAQGQQHVARGDDGHRGAALPPGAGLQPGLQPGSRNGTCASRWPTPSCAASSPRTTASAASARPSPTTTSRPSPVTVTLRPPPSSRWGEILTRTVARPRSRTRPATGCTCGKPTPDDRCDRPRPTWHRRPDRRG